MKNNPDIFGIAFKDFLAGEVDGTIYIKTNVAGIEKLPVMYFFRGVKELPEWERLALEMTKGRVLDAGAGAGSHSIILQNKGHDVVALDLSPGAVEIMKDRGVINTVNNDFHDFTDDQKFDTMLFLMNGLGLAGKLSGLEKTLMHCHELLTPDGVIILESSDLIYLYENEDGSALIDLAANYYGEVVYTLSYKKHVGKPFDWLFLDYDNLEEIAGSCGFDAEMVYKGDSYNYLAVLKRK